MRIALDVMGGDLGPAEPVAGAVQAAREDGVQVLLVGRRAVIEAELAKHRDLPPGSRSSTRRTSSRCPISRRRRCRAKPESSLVVGIAQVRSGPRERVRLAWQLRARSMVAALLGLRRIRGVERPAIATPFPTLKGHCLVCDIGANADCRPEQLVQFAIMGSAYVERVFGRPRPRVGLLSNGEEDSKGNALVREAHPAAARVGRELRRQRRGQGHLPAPGRRGRDGRLHRQRRAQGRRGSGAFVKELIEQEARRNLLGMLGGLMMKPAFGRVRRRIDYDEYGGGPLLGVDGVCIIAHGRSNAKAIRSALRVARHAAETGLPEAIRNGITTHPSTLVASKG